LREFGVYRSGAPEEFSVELQWSFRWSFGGVFGGAPVEFSVELRWMFEKEG
jgi:hypothetical protein